MKSYKNHMLYNVRGFKLVDAESCRPASPVD